MPRLVIAWLVFVAATVTAVAQSAPEQRLFVVTTTTDLAAIAREAGGSRVDVRSLAIGTQDPHYVEPKPSLILDLRRADVYAQIGLGLEIGWAPVLLDQARNPQVHRGGRGHLDLSTVAEVLDVPRTRVTRAEGDLHPYGNPHYWLEPENGLRMAAAFAAKFAELDPGGAEEYERNRAAFQSRLEAARGRWRAQLAPHAGAPVVAYHASWKYFLEFAGLTIIDYIEPRPGIPPSPRHLADLITRMTSVRARAVIVDPFYDLRVPRTVSERGGARLLVLPSSVGGVPAVESYLDLFDHNVRSLVDALGT
jgi:zinc/manganese transport system substrate-binding protein